MRTLIFLILLPYLLFAEGMLQPGEQVSPITLNDQRDVTHTIGSERFWVITWDRATTREANDYFSGNDALLKSGEAAMIVDVSQTPSGIMSLFVLPKMQQYAHTILLSYDEVYNRMLPYKAGHMTLLTLAQGKILRVDYAADAKTLADYLYPTH
jgi:hypothetical protein